MKKGKNIILLIGLVCLALQLCLHIYKFYLYLYQNVPGNILILLTFNVIFSLIAILIPLILFVRNLKNRRSKLISIVSIILNCSGLCMFLLSIMANLPRYIIYRELGFDLSTENFRFLINTILTDFPTFAVIGHVFLIIGSILSLPKKKEQITTNDEMISA